MLTPALIQALAALAETTAQGQRETGRSLALALWPDSPAWSRRTRFHGSNHPGQLGGTMPMLGARLLWRLERLGYAHQLYPRQWITTPAGVRALAEACT